LIFEGWISRNFQVLWLPIATCSFIEIYLLYVGIFHFKNSYFFIFLFDHLYIILIDLFAGLFLLFVPFYHFFQIKNLILSIGVGLTLLWLPKLSNQLLMKFNEVFKSFLDPWWYLSFEWTQKGLIYFNLYFFLPVDWLW